jgi:hypothetical protein
MDREESAMKHLANHQLLHRVPPPLPQNADTSPQSGRNYHIIDQHLLKARQSNAQAQRLQAQGLHADAEAQNRLTLVLIHNALCRVKPPGHKD